MTLCVGHVKIVTVHARAQVLVQVGTRDAGVTRRAKDVARPQFDDAVFHDFPSTVSMTR